MLRFYAALLAGKLTLFGTKALKSVLHRDGTTFPGKVVLKICPEFLKYIDKPSKIIAITGTNGKTTTTNIIADALTSEGYKVLSNRLGGNIARGIATCLMQGVSVFNRTRYEVAVLEVDERSSRLIYPYVQPDFIVCTNLSRDSCKRNAHPYYIFDFIDSAIPEKSVLILNADDGISSQLKKENKRIYYSIDRQPEDRPTTFNIINDMRVCPRCHEPLVYDFVRYNHIGKMHCPNCGFASPVPDIRATEVDYVNNQLVIDDGTDVTTYPQVFDSIFNAYNELSAITLLRAFGMKKAAIQNAMEKIHVVGSRFRSDKVRGINIISTMTKGWIAPSCSVAFDFVSQQPGQKEVIIMIEDTDDNIYSSENLCYIYDTDFEFFNKPDVENVIVAGIRAKDYYLRMLLAGIPREKLHCVMTIEDINKHLIVRKGLDIHIIYDLHQMEAFHKIRENTIQAVKEAKL